MESYERDAPVSTRPAGATNFQKFVRPGPTGAAMTALWTSDDAALATGGRATRPFAATGLSIDTRTLQPGDLFIALTAARDGHDFVAAALGKGAAAAMVSRRPEGVAEDAPLLIVEDVQAALEALGRAGRARAQARVAAITGSVGKTSTKEMLRTALSGQGRVHAAEASYNNHWGVPLTLARMPADADFAVIEIGMNQPGEIAPLARMARPHVAMITTIAAAHLEAFDDLAGIAAEKSAIFEGLEPGGTAVFNGDLDAWLLDIIARAAGRATDRAVRFGSAPDCLYRLEEALAHADATVIRAALPMGQHVLKLTTPGLHFAANALGVLAVVDALGADPVTAALDLGQWQPPGGRGTLETIALDAAREEECLTLIDEAVNANPTSIAAALDTLSRAAPVDGVGRTIKGRRIAVLGDMLELGPTEAALHAGLADLPVMASVHLVHTVGPRMRALHEALPEEKRGTHVDAADDLTGRIGRLIDAGDVVLVKGSKGSLVSRVVDAIRKMGQRHAPTEGEAE